MKKSIKKTSSTIKNIYYNSPVKISFFVLLAAVIIFYSIDKPEELTSYNALVFLLLKVLATIILLVILFSFVSCFIAYLLHKKRNTPLDIKFEHSLNNSTVAYVHNTSRAPFLGWIKTIFNFNDFNTKPYTLEKNKKDEFNVLEINFPTIKHYSLKSVTLYFIDVFGLFSFKIKQHAVVHVSTLPEHDIIDDLLLNPNQQRQETKKSDIIHRQEGELLNFKNFEPSDDIRRIVWQIYAKNKELVIRSVEMQNMYVSEITVLPLFSNIIHNLPASEKLNNFFIDVYKNKLWGIAQGLLKEKSTELKLLPDQVINAEPIQGVSNFANSLSCLEWVDSSERKPRASIYCVSSFTDMHDLEELEININSYFIFATISSEIKKYSTLDIILSIFIKSSNKFDIVDWLKSPFRKKIINNEKAIRDFLDGKHKVIEI